MGAFGRSGGRGSSGAAPAGGQARGRDAGGRKVGGRKAGGRRSGAGKPWGARARDDGDDGHQQEEDAPGKGPRAEPVEKEAAREAAGLDAVREKLATGSA
ncbi:hypothetical protein [Streptomyces narbonensis]|uniref:hypothetical protein n=1 Tax=Streptomyces narbonensis TaxID=67333 RepID=UPI001672BBF5|nr:hypothetical protein [Streptomyces narbonensis]GGV98408.1 hypothetical protein GCM10010230_21880 [Streptomyces narbonensis]